MNSVQFDIHAKNNLKHLLYRGQDGLSVNTRTV